MNSGDEFHILVFFCSFLRRMWYEYHAAVYQKDTYNSATSGKNLTSKQIGLYVEMLEFRLYTILLPKCHLTGMGFRTRNCAEAKVLSLDRFVSGTQEPWISYTLSCTLFTTKAGKITISVGRSTRHMPHSQIVMLGMARQAGKW